MTISRKLYVGFGSILGILVLLSLVSFTTSPREHTTESNGIRTLANLLRDAQNKATDDRLREAYSAIESNQQSWEDDFSKPLIAKRHQVDAGQTTVSDLQIVYLQRSTSNWVEKSGKEMDDAERSIQKALEGSNESANTAAFYSSLFLTMGTIIGAIIGMIVAYRTSLSITRPLEELIAVTREIAETGDLDQKIA